MQLCLKEAIVLLVDASSTNGTKQLIVLFIVLKICNNAHKYKYYILNFAYLCTFKLKKDGSW